ncbi:hypothetical protein F5Y19DRAFT_22604 [Xylariaceae sp. FL1651]|nr:hypothetical protein F5Y19DRAFT_22604 [Xylariaceae sp. FL1651]
MDRYLGQIWAMSPIAKPEGKRLRRKLQKIGTQQRPYSANYSDTKTTSERSLAKSTLQPTKPDSSRTSASTQKLSSPLPADPDDGKWLDDFRKSGYLCRESRGPTQSDVREKPRKRPSSMVPEFAHLTVGDNKPHAPQPGSISPPTRNPPSSIQTTRRYAKTPVSYIGQLEIHPLLRGQEPAHNASSIESIAESYRALLESRCSFMSEATVGYPTIPEESEQAFVAQDSSLLPAPLAPVVELPETPLVRGSPRSDDGTLVAFEEDSIYSKPTSASPVPSSPSQSNYETALPTLESEIETPQHSPSLQICFDLLTRELSSAVSGSTARPNTETSALQIWVMIEAYEKLRDQIQGMEHGDPQRAPLKAMLDMWLKALYKIHNDMTGNDGQRSESNYGD